MLLTKANGQKALKKKKYGLEEAAIMKEAKKKKAVERKYRLA
jgi:hypothetical protein